MPTQPNKNKNIEKPFIAAKKVQKEPQPLFVTRDVRYFEHSPVSHSEDADEPVAHHPRIAW